MLWSRRLCNIRFTNPLWSLFLHIKKHYFTSVLFTLHQLVCSNKHNKKAWDHLEWKSFKYMKTHRPKMYSKSTCSDETQISLRQNGSLLFPPCRWVLYSSPCEAVLETPRCLHLYRLGWVCSNVAISLFIRITVRKLQYSRTAPKPGCAQLLQSKRHFAVWPGERCRFPTNSQAYPPYPRVFQH